MGHHTEEDIERFAMKGLICIRKRDGIVTMDAAVEFTHCMRSACWLNEAESVRLLSTILYLAKKPYSGEIK
jgi:hypothetical protein